MSANTTKLTNIDHTLNGAAKYRAITATPSSAIRTRPQAAVARLVYAVSSGVSAPCRRISSTVHSGTRPARSDAPKVAAISA